MIENPLVSCVIPTYKRSELLSRAIDSVLEQSYSNIEVLVVDDNEKCSSDSLEVRRIVESYFNPKVKLVTQPKHFNGAEARNAGVRASVGDYIAFLDDDDYWMPTKLEKQIQALKENPEFDGCSCLYSFYSGGNVVRSCAPYSGENLHRKIIGRDVAVCTPTLLLNKEKLMEAGLFNNTLKRHQDLQLLLDFTLHHKFYVLNEYLVKVNTESGINRANDVQRLIEVKRKFFEACSNHLNLYSKEEQRDILAAHYFEIVLVALRGKEYGVVLKYLAKIGLNFRAYSQLLKRMKERKLKVEIV